MGTNNDSDAVHQITVRGYPVGEVSRRFGVSRHSLYKGTEERDILKRATVSFARGSQ